MTPSSPIMYASRQVPAAGRSGSAFQSSTSASSEMVVEQVVDALAGDGAGLDELDVAAHVVGEQLLGVELPRASGRCWRSACPPC